MSGPPTTPGAGPGLRVDALAGLTVALVGLPQCLAYALMSGLPPAHGLSTAAVAGFVAAGGRRTARCASCRPRRSRA
jgi:SulP family sulfate permease